MPSKITEFIIALFIKGWLNLGNKQRATAATGMNDKSSRSHSVFTLVLTQTQVRHLKQNSVAVFAAP